MGYAHSLPSTPYQMPPPLPPGSYQQQHYQQQPPQKTEVVQLVPLQNSGSPGVMIYHPFDAIKLLDPRGHAPPAMAHVLAGAAMRYADVAYFLDQMVRSPNTGTALRDWQHQRMPPSSQPPIPVPPQHPMPQPMPMAQQQTRSYQPQPTATSKPQETPLPTESTVRNVNADKLMEAGEDEYVPETIDTEGEKKVAQSGHLRGEREYCCTTFQVPGHGDKLFMLAEDCAQTLGYCAAWQMFDLNKSLFRLMASKSTKYRLVADGVLPIEHRARQVAIVSARSIFRRFGSRIVADGRRLQDDYWVTKACEIGVAEDDVPWELPSADDLHKPREPPPSSTPPVAAQSPPPQDESPAQISEQWNDGYAYAAAAAHVISPSMTTESVPEPLHTHAPQPLQTLETQETPSIRQMARRLSGNPPAVRRLMHQLAETSSVDSSGLPSPAAPASSSSAVGTSPVPRETSSPLTTSPAAEATSPHVATSPMIANSPALMADDFYGIMPTTSPSSLRAETPGAVTALVPAAYPVVQSMPTSPVPAVPESKPTQDKTFTKEVIQAQKWLSNRTTSFSKAFDFQDKLDNLTARVGKEITKTATWTTKKNAITAIRDILLAIMQTECSNVSSQCRNDGAYWFEKNYKDAMRRLSKAELKRLATEDDGRWVERHELLMREAKSYCTMEETLAAVLKMLGDASKLDDADLESGVAGASGVDVIVID